MAVRKTRPRSPASTRPEESLPGATSGRLSRAAEVPSADDAPATAGMLRHLRTEVLQRIEQGDEQLRDEMRQMKDDLRGEIRHVSAGLAAVRGDVLGLKADMARVLFLVEEQNARNRAVPDGLMSVVSRQDRLERRTDAVEATIRDLASSRRP